MTTTKWRSIIALSTAAVLAGGLLAGCSSSSSKGSTNSNPLVQSKPTGTIVVASNSFAESTLLADIYGQALAAKGFTIKYQLNVGARAVSYQQISSGAITVMPEYNGALLDYLDTTAKKSAEAQTSTSSVDSELTADLPSSLEILNPASAQDNDTLTLTPAEAKKLNLSQGASISDFVTALGTQQITIGAAPEYQTKTDGLLGIEQVYGLKASQVVFKPLDEGGPLTEAAMTNGSVEAGDLYTTDTTIAKGSMVTLTDPKNIFGLQNVVPLAFKADLPQSGVDALNAVSAKLDSATLLKLDNENTTQGEDPATVAKTWLTSEGLI